MPNAPRPALKALTGLRFLAAFHVVIFHCAAWSSWSAPAVVVNVAGAGFVSVSLFFVLSGFILAYTYAKPEGFDARPLQFYAARLSRIYPVYVLGLLAAAPFFVSSRMQDGGPGFDRLVVEALAVLLLVQSYAPDLAFAWNPPAWSLSAEMSFYLLFPFVAPRLFAMSRRRAAFVAGALVVVAIAWPLLYLWARPDGLAHVDHATSATWLHVLKFDPLVRAPEFLLGVVAGRFFLEGVRPSARAASIGVGACIAIVLAVLAAGDAVPFPLVHNGLLAPVYALLVVCLAVGAGPIASWLARPSLQVLGESSYALYILHLPLYVLAASAAKRVVGRPVLQEPWFVVAFLLLSVVASIAAYRRVEDPSRRRMRAFLDAVVRAKVPRRP
jgi:peptidoglycan/LPS O-acetylase OafA/YrhL